MDSLYAPCALKYGFDLFLSLFHEIFTPYILLPDLLTNQAQAFEFLSL